MSKKNKELKKLRREVKELKAAAQAGAVVITATQKTKNEVEEKVEADSGFIYMRDITPDYNGVELFTPNFFNGVVDKYMIVKIEKNDDMLTVKGTKNGHAYSDAIDISDFNAGRTTLYKSIKVASREVHREMKRIEKRFETKKDIVSTLLNAMVTLKESEESGKQTFQGMFTPLELVVLAKEIENKFSIKAARKIFATN